MRIASLLAAFGGVFVAFSPTVGAAQTTCYSHHHGHSAHTPARGSTERTAIMAAIHAKTGIQDLLSVDHLKVSHGWAWAVVHAQGADPAGVLLRGGGNHWTATDVLDGDDFTDSVSALRDRFPNVPSSIFR